MGLSTSISPMCPDLIPHLRFAPLAKEEPISYSVNHSRDNFNKRRLSLQGNVLCIDMACLTVGFWLEVKTLLYFCYATSFILDPAFFMLRVDGCIEKLAVDALTQGSKDMRIFLSALFSLDVFNPRIRDHLIHLACRSYTPSHKTTTIIDLVRDYQGQLVAYYILELAQESHQA